eukprot:3884661-Rhodomonas_salina.4
MLASNTPRPNSSTSRDTDDLPARLSESAGIGDTSQEAVRHAVFRQWQRQRKGSWAKNELWEPEEGQNTSFGKVGRWVGGLWGRAGTG